MVVVVSTGVVNAVVDGGGGGGVSGLGGGIAGVKGVGRPCYERNNCG